MTVTKRIFLEATESAGMDDVIFMDNGHDSIECRAIEVTKAGACDHISTQTDGNEVPDGSIVLRAW